MKVLYLIETLGVGGAEQSLLQILSRLRATRPVMCHIYEGRTLRPAYEAAGIPVVSLDIPPKYHFRAAIRAVEAVVRREQPDVIHTTLFRAEVVGRIVGRRMGLPVVCSFVSECYADVRWRTLTPAGRLKLTGVQLLDRATAPLATHFVSNSHTVKRSETRSLGVPEEKVTVIHRGRDPRDFDVALTADEARALRTEIDAPGDGPIVLMVGRLVDSKGHRELVDAFARVARADGAATLVLAGDGPEQGNIERQVAALGLEGRVRVLGPRDDVPRLLALATIFAFPSHYEGHPGALVEAMLAGKAIVASDIPVHRETLTDGETGMLVPLRDAAAIAAAILALLSDGRRAAALGAAARAIAVDRFDVRRAAERYDALYADVVARYDRVARPVVMPAGAR